MRKYDVRKLAVITCAAVLASFSLTACGSRKTEGMTPEEAIEQAESADSAIVNRQRARTARSLRKLRKSKRRPCRTLSARWISRDPGKMKSACAPAWTL